jgi:hypothetical protein
MIRPRYLSLILLFILLTSTIGCVSRQANSIPSPDGHLILVTAINHDKTDLRTYLCVKFQITDNAGHVLYEEQTYASNRMKWDIKWDGNERIVLDSSDIGTYTWELTNDGRWQKTP